MSSNIEEDAGLFCAGQNNDPEVTENTRRQRKRRRRSSSAKSNAQETDSNKISKIVISPEDIPDEYDYNEDIPGLLVLFNLEKFKKKKNLKRRGTQKDQEDLVDCLSRLKYEVRNNLLFQNSTKKEIEDELQKIVNMDHSKRSSLIVVFLTHGDKNGQLICHDNKIITCEEIWNFFTADKCPTLKGKPKIFIFQACKGDEKCKVVDNIQTDSILRTDMAKKNYTLPAEADILVAYSTIEGTTSFRDRKMGAWYIQELCKNLTAYGRRDDIVTIFTRVSKCVAYHYQHMKYKQMPCFTSTLTKKFYICKSMERSFFLELREQNEKLLEGFKKMQQQLEALQKKDEETEEMDVDEDFQKNSKKSKKLFDRP